MKQRIKAKLPTGVYDDNEHPVTLDVELVRPDRVINNYAFELTKPFEARGEDAAIAEAMMNQLRLCVKSIGGKSVDYADLQGKQIHKQFDPKQIELLLNALRHLTTANEGDVLYCYKSVRLYADESGEHLRSTKLPTGKYKDDKPVARDIVFAVPNRSLISKAYEMSRQFEGRSSLMVSSEGELNVVRLCLRKVDGKSLSLDDLRGDELDKLFSQIEQSCLVQVMQKLMMPDKNEVADFLSSLDDGSTSKASDTMSEVETTTALTTDGSI